MIILEIAYSKFAYSPSESAFKKQTKAIKDQAEQQIKAIKHNKKQLDNKQQGNTGLLLSKEREIFKNIYNQRFDKMDELSKKNDYGDLKFTVNITGLETDFSASNDPLTFLDIT